MARHRELALLNLAFIFSTIVFHILQINWLWDVFSDKPIGRAPIIVYGGFGYAEIDTALILLLVALIINIIYILKKD